MKLHAAHGSNMHIADRILLHKQLVTATSSIMVLAAFLLLPLGLLTSVASLFAKPLSTLGAGTTATAVASLSAAVTLTAALERARQVSRAR